ncbi:hypothetical protein IQ07DRAFT_576951 [Pyrenochaeta sp. DS3sAY3a]|nr:hypothetical protein IQ07DRAFT_576951 [Pyrenochaeta sp. DS3sAY3a]
MSAFRFGELPLRLAWFASRAPLAPSRPICRQFRGQLRPRAYYSNQRKPTPSRRQSQSPAQEQSFQRAPEVARDVPEADFFNERLEKMFPKVPRVKVRYARPGMWALAVSSGIFVGLAFLEAKREEKHERAKKMGSWLEAPQWITPRNTPLGPTELATKMWSNLDDISKLSVGLIAANTAVHASSFVVPNIWMSLWHMPARNVNYTQFTSMFVHSGILHIFFNMYVLNNFLLPVGYSRVFEGNVNHTLAFFLSTGVLAGYAQHASTLIKKNTRMIPDIFIRAGGASGALCGVFGVLCMQYPHAGMGIMFLPVHFEAQYVLPAVMLFDFVGMVRGYSFLNLGHAAHLGGIICGISYSYFDGKNNIWNPLVRFWRRQLKH